MTPNETLHLLIDQAQSNGFDFRRWYQSHIRFEWLGTKSAVNLLLDEGRYFSLICSHDFAQALWKQGARMNFIVPSKTYSRMNGKGEVVTINRKPFTRRTIKANVWKYHLRQMVTSDDPMVYLQRFLPKNDALPSYLEELDQELDSLGATG